MLKQATRLVAAYVRHNRVRPEELATLINAAYSGIAGLSATTVVVEAPEPAVPVKKSVTADYIVCLEDGKRLKMLKRHLQVRYGMSPDEYRTKWGLPADYPMTAPNYAERRSTLAKQIGLGRKPGTTAKAGPKAKLSLTGTAKAIPVVASDSAPVVHPAADKPHHTYPTNRWSKKTD